MAGRTDRDESLLALARAAEAYVDGRAGCWPTATSKDSAPARTVSQAEMGRIERELVEAVAKWRARG